MVEKRWWKNIYFSHTEVHVDVMALKGGNDSRMTYGIYLSLVHPWVERCDIDVFDFFSLSCMCFIMEAYSVRSSTKESIPGIEWVHQLVECQELLKIFTGFYFAVPVTFPLRQHSIPSEL